MSGLLERLKAGRTAVKTLKVGEVALGLRVLAEQDYLDAEFATEAAMRAAGLELNLATAEAWEAEKASQLLLRAVIDPDTGKPLASNAKELREAISRDEKAAIIEAYLDHEKAFSPSERTMGEAEFSALLEEVKKNPQTTRLNASSSATLKRLITALASPPSS